MNWSQKEKKRKKHRKESILFRNIQRIWKQENQLSAWGREMKHDHPKPLKGQIKAIKTNGSTGLRL